MADDLLRELSRSDPWIAAITPERIENALAGFRLPLADGWTIARLCDEIQGMANIGRGEPPQSNAKAIAELRRLSDKAEALVKGIKRAGDTAQRAAFFEFFRRTSETDNSRVSDYGEAYQAALIDAVQLVHEVLARAASQIGTEPKQRPRWTERERQQKRVGFAVMLMPVFEAAFATTARANNWQADFGMEHPWAEFFRRVYSELFPGATRLNVPEVLQEAAREAPQLAAFVKQWNAQEATRGDDS